MSYIYLATPYSHPDKEIREKRYIHACQIAGKLMRQGEKVFCPIAHSHPIETVGMSERQSADFWLDQDFAILKHAEMLMVCMMPGWAESHGVNEEINFAHTNKIPVCYIEP